MFGFPDNKHGSSESRSPVRNIDDCCEMADHRLAGQVHNYFNQTATSKFYVYKFVLSLGIQDNRQPERKTIETTDMYCGRCYGYRGLRTKARCRYRITQHHTNPILKHYKSYTLILFLVYCKSPNRFTNDNVESSARKKDCIRWIKSIRELAKISYN